MAHSDDPKQQRSVQTSKPATRRPVSAHDFRMPKPYRKPVLTDETRLLSRQQLVLLSGATAAIAALIFTLALLARTRPDPLPVALAAEPPATLTPVKAVRKIVRRRIAVPVPPATLVAASATESGHPAPAEPRPPFKLLIPATPAPQPAASVLPLAPEPDPDVDLIATILTLFPPAPPCVVAGDKGDGCQALQAVQR